MGDSVLKALSYSRSTEVLSYLEGDEQSRFVDIERDLSLNPNIVNTRLKDLRNAGLVNKVERGKYVLTDKGVEALEILEEYDELLE